MQIVLIWRDSKQQWGQPPKRRRQSHYRHQRANGFYMHKHVQKHSNCFGSFPSSSSNSKLHQNINKKETAAFWKSNSVNGTL